VKIIVKQVVVDQLKNLLLIMKTLNHVKHHQKKVILDHVNLVFQVKWKMLMKKCGLLKMKMLELGLNIDLNHHIKYHQFLIKIETM
jgi:hypothetical protein